ncbi:MAG: von Willebrand factor type A domain-containing protein, partial [Planctomycetota bacterium]
MEHDQEMNDPGRDPVHELLCKIVFGEATDEEREEAEALLAESEERRAQLAEIEATVALVRGAREAEMPDVLGDDRFDAVVAAGAAVDDAPPVGGAARFRGARLLAAAAALAVCGAGAAWWSSSQAANDGEFLAYDIGDARVARLDPVEASDEPAAGVDMGEELKVVTQPPQSSAAGRLVDAGPIFGDGTDTALEVDPFKQHRDQLMSAEKEKPEGAFIGYSTVTTPDVQVPYLSEVPFDVVKLQREFSNAATESSDPTALESAGVSAYKGPGDSVPPSTVVGGELQLLERKRASGPSSPGPASRLSPEIAARLESLGYSGATPGADTEGPGADTEGPRWLSGNGYADSTTESAASDAFFLGRGLARPVDELRTFHRVPRCEPTRRPNERPRDMFFRFWGDNPYVVTKQDAQSTFAADVDTASFSLARRMLREGYLPPREQVRTEEFVNFARPDLAPPAEGTFAIHGELAPSPFGGREDRWLLRVGVRAAEIERSERPPLALTFVVDTSGSMREDNRLELVKHAMRLLVGQLDARDSIAIVRFANDASEVLAPTPATARDAIETALFALQPTGSTNAEGGLKLGYSLAEQTLLEGVQSRVVFLSDGVANVGETDQARIAADVAHSAQRGIFLNTIGVGMANHNDAFLEQLADEGQGVCDYVGDAEDARRAIVERFVGGFVTLAKDVKIQVEFDPGQVLRWRQLGYENRAVRDADFRNDAID